MTVCPTGKQAHYLRAQNNLYPSACHLQKYRESFFNHQYLCGINSQKKSNLLLLSPNSKTTYLKFFPLPNVLFHLPTPPISITYQTQTRSKFTQSPLIQDGLCDTPVCVCGSGSENETHFLLLCGRYQIPRTILLNRVTNIVDDVSACFKTKRSAEVKDI